MARGLKREDEIDRHQSDRFDPTRLQQAEQNASDEYGLSARQENKLQNKLDRAEKQLDDYSPEENIGDVRQQEATLTSGLYTGSGRPEKKETVSLKTVLKKKGPLAALLALGLGLPTVLAIMLSPALLLQQMAETMTGEFNDQLAALDARSTLLLKKKLNSTITKNVCGTKVTIGCKYQSIRENSGMAKRLKKAGVDIKGNKSIIPGRIKPTHFVFEGKEIPAKDLLGEARQNPALRSALRKGYDPLYAAFSDKISTKVRSKLGLKRNSGVESSANKEKMNEDLKKTAKGNIEEPSGKLNQVTSTDEDGNSTTHYKDDKGNIYSEADKNLVDESIERTKLAESIGKTAVKSTLKSALTASALGAGVVDSACTAWNTVRVAAFAAKVLQQRQLIRYSYEFMKIAHKQKYGDLTTEDMEFFGNKLTSTNSEGKAAFDAAGYKFAAYGDPFKVGEFNAPLVQDKNSPKADEEAEKILIQNETNRYVNGQLLNDNLMSKLAKLASGSTSTEAADKSCKFVKSWTGQAMVVGLAIAGLAVGIFSGGTTIGLGAAANAAASVSLSVAFALIQPKLLDMVKGEVIKGDENGNETGNAIASGMGGYNAQASQERGLGVAPQGVYSAYSQLNDQVIARNAEIERSERSPFDPSSKHTFLGSIVSSIVPYTSKVSTVGSASVAVSSLVTSSFASLGIKQTVSAEGKKEKYSQCEDHEYEGLAADPFCNLRYAIPTDDLKIDPDEVLEFMTIKNNYATPEDPTPLGEYANYVKKCFERKNSIGDGQTDSSEGAGEECIIGKGGSNEYRNKMFRLFYLDTSVSDGSDEDFEYDGDEGSSTTPTTEGSELVVGTYNILNTDGHPEDSINTAGSACNRSSDPKCIKTRANYQAEIILGKTKDSPQIDLIGTQETSPSQYRTLKGLLPDYDGVPSTERDINRLKQQENGATAILWNTEKLTKVEEGKTNLISNVATGQNRGRITAPWVALQNSNGEKIYVLSIHFPIANFSDPQLGDNGTLKEAVRLTLNWVNEKKKDGKVIVMGDFNDHTFGGSNTGGGIGVTYCDLTANAVMQNTFDMANGVKANPAKPCPNPKPNKGIDHIYITPGDDVSASEWKHLKKVGGSAAVVHGSDHMPVYVKLQIGENESNSGEVAWPVDKEWRNSILDAHGGTGTAWGEDSMGTANKGAYIAVDIGMPSGKKVYAMVGGKVTSTSLCGSNDGIAIKSTVDGKTLGAAYMHGTNKQFKVGDTVRAGQYIMDTGVIGCSVRGAHLHVGMALDGKYICPQDVFVALGKNQKVDWASLPAKTGAGCGR